MKLKLFIFTFLCLVELLSCQHAAKVVNQSTNNANHSKTTETLSLKGEFTSKAGVMVLPSCFCANNGELLTPEGETIIVCLDKLKSTEIKCKNVIIKGKFEVLTNNPEPTSPCSKGELKVFQVEEISCDK